MVMKKLDKTVIRFLNGVNSYKNEEDVLNYFLQCTILSIATIRGIKGNEFVDDFLKAALNEKDKLVITPQRIQ